MLTYCKCCNKLNNNTTNIYCSNCDKNLEILINIYTLIGSLLNYYFPEN